MNTTTNTVNALTPAQQWDQFTKAVHATHTPAVDGTHRGVRHGAFTQSIAVATVAIEGLKPGLYPVRLISKEHGVQGWALREAAIRMIDKGAKLQLVKSGQKGDASVICVLADGEKQEPAVIVAK
jgi:hypothetical protein